VLMHNPMLVETEYYIEHLNSCKKKKRRMREVSVFSYPGHFLILVNLLNNCFSTVAKTP